MGIRKMDHVAIAVKDITASLNRWEKALGLEPGEVEDLPERGVRLCKLSAPGSPALELISPLGDDSTVARFLSDHGEGIHHFCFEVPDIEESLESLKQQGVRLIHERPVLGAEGSRIAFLHPGGFNGVLIELVEKREGRSKA
jgi:methylmalonyl-CoA epimerase